MRNVPDKSCRENQNTHFIFSNFVSENLAVYEIMWKNMVRVRQATDDSIILCKERCDLRATKARIETHS